MESLGQELYTDSAAVGRVSAKIGMVISIIIGAMMVLFGIIIFFSRPPPPDPAKPPPANNKLVGLVVIGIGFLVGAMGVAIDALSKKYKFLAAGEGVSAISRMF